MNRFIYVLLALSLALSTRVASAADDERMVRFSLLSVESDQRIVTADYVVLVATIS